MSGLGFHPRATRPGGGGSLPGRWAARKGWARDVTCPQATSTTHNQKLNGRTITTTTKTQSDFCRTNASLTVEKDRLGRRAAAGAAPGTLLISAPTSPALITCLTPGLIAPQGQHLAVVSQNCMNHVR